MGTNRSETEYQNSLIAHRYKCRKCGFDSESYRDVIEHVKEHKLFYNCKCCGKEITLHDHIYDGKCKECRNDRSK